MGLLHNTTVTTRTLTTLLLVAVLLLLLGTTVVSASRRSGSQGRGRSRGAARRCQPLPRFRVSGVEPLTLTRGHVTVAALLTSTCTFCLQQATRMQNLSDSLQANGSDVHMMIINGGPRPTPGREGAFERRVSFPVYHDDDSQTIWNQVFQGNKDDIFVIDRCGRLTYRIPFPYSYLRYTYVSRALQRTLTSNMCDCNPASQDPHDMMMGDAPALGRSGRRTARGPGRNRQGRNFGEFRGGGGRRGGGGGPSYSHRNLNRSRCPRDDTLCRDMRKARRRYNYFLRQHSIHSQHGMPEEQILGLFQRSQRGMSMGPVF